MKNFADQLFMSLLLLTLLGCGTKPLDKKYRSQTMWYDIRVGSKTKNDSIHHELCKLATAENTKNGVKNEDLTYQELIDQGYMILSKTHTEVYVDSLREVYGK